MEIIKSKSKHYPQIAFLSDGTLLAIPKQSAYKDDYIRRHGCSIMAERIALQFAGIRKTPAWLKKWHAKHTPARVKPKTTVSAVADGLEQIGKGRLVAKYYRVASEARIRVAMEKGLVVILEQGPPGTKTIHTVCLIPDEGQCWCASHGKCVKVDIGKIAKTATTSEKYRGMITVKRLS